MEGSTYSDYSRPILQSTYLMHHSSRGETAKKVDEAYRNIVSGKSTEKDVDVIANFLQLCKAIDRAMTIRNGKESYPCNYFLFAPKDMTPIAFKSTVSKLLKKDVLNEEDTEFLANLKLKLSHKFPSEGFHDFKDSKVHPTEMVLRNLRIKRTLYFDGKKRELDFTTDEAFKELCQDVDRIIKEYDLPNYSYCVYSIGSALSRGCEPVFLNDELRALRAANTFAENAQTEQVPKIKSAGRNKED